jgi:hypothetical protein
MSGAKVITTTKGEPRFGPEGMELWRLTGLRPGRTPAWFRKIVQRDYAGRFNTSWFDHSACDGESLVVEPYGIDGDSLRDLLAFADRYSLGLDISATTFHFPTRTICISLKPRERTTS